jgi:hypothetical protein
MVRLVSCTQNVSAVPCYCHSRLGISLMLNAALSCNSLYLYFQGAGFGDVKIDFATPVYQWMAWQLVTDTFASDDAATAAEAALVPADTPALDVQSSTQEVAGESNIEQELHDAKQPHDLSDVVENNSETTNSTQSALVTAHVDAEPETSVEPPEDLHESNIPQIRGI